MSAQTLLQPDPRSELLGDVATAIEIVAWELAEGDITSDDLRRLHSTLMYLAGKLIEGKPAELTGDLTAIDGAIHVSIDRHELLVLGQLVALPRKAFGLLACLMVDPYRVVSKRELLATVWGEHYLSTQTRTVDAHASRLREALHGAGLQGVVINTWGVGYSLLRRTEVTA